MSLFYLTVQINLYPVFTVQTIQCGWLLVTFYHILIVNVMWDNSPDFFLCCMYNIIAMTLHPFIFKYTTLFQFQVMVYILLVACFINNSYPTISA